MWCEGGCQPKVNQVCSLPGAGATRRRGHDLRCHLELHVRILLNLLIQRQWPPLDLLGGRRIHLPGWCLPPRLGKGTRQGPATAGPGAGRGGTQRAAFSWPEAAPLHTHLLSSTRAGADVPPVRAGRLPNTPLQFRAGLGPTASMASAVEEQGPARRCMGEGMGARRPDAARCGGGRRWPQSGTRLRFTPSAWARSPACLAPPPSEPFTQDGRLDINTGGSKPTSRQAP
jgi:hypothetical protein